MAKAFSKPEKKQLGHEYVDGEEEGIISEMVQELKVQLSRLYPTQKMLRQVHTKMHGCVRGEFIVEPGLADDLRSGVFKDSVSFPAWIRFSNANTIPQPDKKKDIRGIAIKLMDVRGDKILNDHSHADSQDFLLMSSETFFAKNLRHFRNLLKIASGKNKLSLLAFFLNPFHWKMMSRIMKSNIVCGHPFEICYWSTQPYQYGNGTRAVKYSVQPSANNELLYTGSTADNYLRSNMAKTLESKEINFDFFIQFQTDAEKMPIEDPTVRWTSPFIKVATIKIPSQTFDAPQQLEFGDDLSFSPWHSLPEHRPLGSFNRARRRVYEELSQFRHDRNGIKVFEPSPLQSVPEVQEKREHKTM